MKKTIILILLIVVSISSCKKKSADPAPLKLGYDHSTPEGIFLGNISGFNRALKKITFTYYNSSNVSIGTYNEYVAPNQYLLFDDGLTTNAQYGAIAEVTTGGPLNDNTESDVHIEDGVTYLYYQPDIHATPTSQPATVIKVQCTLSDNNATMTLVFTDGAGTASEDGITTFNYAKRVRVYTFSNLN